MTTEHVSTFGSRQSLSSFEMGMNGINIICTYGKISIKFECGLPDATVGQILISISKIDPTTVYEHEILCDYEEITFYKSLGFIIISYAKSNDKYKALFNILFNNKTCIYHLSKIIIKKLKNEEFNMDLYWNVDGVKIMRLYEELKHIDGWHKKQIIYK